MEAARTYINRFSDYEGQPANAYRVIAIGRREGRAWDLMKVRFKGGAIMWTMREYDQNDPQWSGSDAYFPSIQPTLDSVKDRLMGTQLKNPIGVPKAGGFFHYGCEDNGAGYSRRGWNITYTSKGEWRVSAGYLTADLRIQSPQFDDIDKAIEYFKVDSGHFFTDAEGLGFSVYCFPTLIESSVWVGTPD